MPTHVYANNNEVASKAADGKSIAAFPDVCFSPPAPPVGPMPLPYPNTGEVKDTDSGTAKVFIKDKMSGMAGDSHMTKSMGDDAATKNFNKGMITGALQGKCYFGLWSMDVQMEGKGVPRHLDMVTHNHASMVGNDPCGANIDSLTPPSTSDKTEPKIEETLSAAFKRKPDHAGGENSDSIFGYCGSPVVVSALGHLDEEETVQFTIENKSNQNKSTVQSDNKSINIWKADWNTPQGLKEDTVFSLTVKSSKIESASAPQNYVIKKLELKKQYLTPYIGKFFASLKDNIVTVSVNMCFDYYEGGYDTYAEDFINFEHYLLGRTGLDYDMSTGRIVQGNKIPNEFEQEKIDFHKKTWDNSIQLGQNNPNVTKVTDLTKRGIMYTRSKNLVEQVTSFFNGKFEVRRRNCIHGSKCSCIYPVEFKFNIVTPPLKNYMHNIRVFETKYYADSGNFALKSEVPGKLIMNTWAHEIGHLMGYYDEYRSAYGNAIRDRVNHIWQVDSHALMDDNSLVLKNYYITEILIWLRNATKMPFISEVK